MKKTIVEYYCDCCGKKVNSEEDLISIQIMYSDHEKSLCNDCYSIYRNAIPNFIKELSNYGIKEDKFYTEVQKEEDDLL